MQIANDINTANFSIDVKATSKPSQPSELKLTTLDNIATLNFKQGFNGGHEQTFVLQTSLNSDESWMNKTVINESDSKYINGNGRFQVHLTNLVPGIYSARLLAFNFLGAADPVEFEEQYEIKELNEGQPSLPTELTLTPMDNTVTFEWKEGLNGGHEQTFVLETSLNSGDSWTNRFTIKESESKYLNENGKFKVNLPNLDPGVYKARLVAFNIIGAADPVEFKKRFEIIKLNQETLPRDSVGPVIGGTVGGIMAALVISHNQK
ncbi:uncharacterized protein LOC128235678 [Mya arenaria]|uniref:uncharacterized protein LOC128235678 n=1 Tax=Mya arenaria TaxID=6604 RepID=UPI0022E545D3|nr:uncharacterized protein LOC128235678 [Mya arenaria]